MKRIFCPDECITKDHVRITDPAEIHYLRDVLRLKTDAQLTVCTPSGGEFISKVEAFLPDHVLLRVKRITPPERHEDMQLTIACAIPKNVKMDDIIDKMTQLGVKRIIPLMTERVIVKLNDHKKDLRLNRWRAIAKNACQQSQRSSIPELSTITPLIELLNNVKEYDLKLISTLAGNQQKINRVLTNIKHPGKILVLIGPEGDFTQREVEQAREAGCMPVSLGQQVLRVDTAAIAIASFIKFYYLSD
ncbi:MAG: RsmE family RNA methyltransferase [Candidatus Omnitrophota bacterium]